MESARRESVGAQGAKPVLGLFLGDGRGYHGILGLDGPVADGLQHGDLDVDDGACGTVGVLVMGIGHWKNDPLLKQSVADAISRTKREARGARWAMRYDSCAGCGTTESAHRGRGLCNACYLKARYYPKRRAPMLARYHGNREAEIEKRRAWRERNPTYFKEYSKRNSERIRLRRRAYHQRLPRSYFYERKQKRRARKYAVAWERVGLLTIVRRDHSRCGLCGGFVPKKQRSLDHIVPLSKGGSHTKANIQLAHLLCNVRRGNRGPAQLRLVV